MSVATCWVDHGSRIVMPWDIYLPKSESDEGWTLDKPPDDVSAFDHTRRIKFGWEMNDESMTAKWRGREHVRAAASVNSV